MGLHFFRSFIEDAAREESNWFVRYAVRANPPILTARKRQMRPLFWALYNAKYNPVFCTPTSGQHIARYRDNWV